MEFFIEYPCEQLKDYVAFYWGTKQNNLNYSGREKIIPTGCMQLFIHYGNSFLASENNQTVKLSNTYICGQKYSSFDVLGTGDTAFTSINFKPYGAKAFLGYSLNEFTNNNFPTEDVLGNEFISIKEQLINTIDYKEQIAIIERYLIYRLNKTKFRDFQLIKYSVDSILNSKFDDSISNIANHLCLSERTFQRKFLESIGLSPKQFFRIGRLQKTIRNFKFYKEKTKLSDLAYDSGFYDQSHFIKEFKLLTGHSPKEFFSNECIESDLIL